MFVDEIRGWVHAASASNDFAGVLRWEGKIDQLLEGQDLDNTANLLAAFSSAFIGTEQWDKASTIGRRYAEACEALGDFLRTAQAMSAAASCCSNAGEGKLATLWYERARDLSAEHGIVLMEVDLNPAP
jgi:hypothetical protein